MNSAKQHKQAKQPKQRRISYLAFFLACGLLLYFFFLGRDAMEQKRQSLLDERSQYQSMLNQAKKDKQDVELEISQAGTDAYIENKARTQYGFLKPGEIRFEITNPEVLFEGTVEPVPTQQP